jgi:TP53 regulating kinase-like protein
LSESNRDLSVLVAQSVGAAIGKMHDADVVHGDLTTSNFIVREPADATIIDFGLGAWFTVSFHLSSKFHLYSSGTMKPTIEDKAVDLYVLERAFISTHPGSEYVVSGFRFYFAVFSLSLFLFFFLNHL